MAATLNWLCDQDLDANVRPFTTGESSKYRSVGGKWLGIVRYRLHLAAGCSQVKSSQVVGQSSQVVTVTAVTD